MAFTTAGKRRHQVTLQNPAVGVPDGDGGVTQAWSYLTPRSVFASIQSADAVRGFRGMERTIAGSVTATAITVITVPYRSDISRRTRVLFGSRTFNVQAILNPEERNVELQLFCVEVVQ